MRVFLLAILFILYFNEINTQTPDNDSLQALVDTSDAWRLGGTGNFSFSQAQISENWVKGGENSLSLLSDFNIFLNYHGKKNTWDNFLLVEYGTFKSASFESFRKSSDRIDLTSKYGRIASGKWYYSFLASYQTQLTRGYEYNEVDSLPNNIISAFNSPGYVVLSLGIDYKPNKIFTLMISPFTSKMTLISDERVNETLFGLKEAKKTKKELGAYLKTYYMLKLYENITWENKLDLFTNYLSHPERIDVDWQSKILFRINKYFTSMITTHVIWDYDIQFENKESGSLERKVQFKEIMSLGFTYNF